MIEVIRKPDMEIKEVVCFSGKNECYFSLVCPIEKDRKTLFGNEVLLNLRCDSKNIEASVCYITQNDTEKDRTYHYLTTFLKKVDGQEIDLNDYVNKRLNETKFPTVRKIRRIWEI